MEMRVGKFERRRGDSVDSNLSSLSDEIMRGRNGQPKKSQKTSPEASGVNSNRKGLNSRGQEDSHVDDRLGILGGNDSKNDNDDVMKMEARQRKLGKDLPKSSNGREKRLSNGSVSDEGYVTGFGSDRGSSDGHSGSRTPLSDITRVQNERTKMQRTRRGKTTGVEKRRKHPKDNTKNIRTNRGFNLFLDNDLNDDGMFDTGSFGVDDIFQDRNSYSDRHSDRYNDNGSEATYTRSSVLQKEQNKRKNSDKSEENRAVYHHDLKKIEEQRDQEWEEAIKEHEAVLNALEKEHEELLEKFKDEYTATVGVLDREFVDPQNQEAYMNAHKEKLQELKNGFLKQKGEISSKFESKRSASENKEEYDKLVEEEKKEIEKAQGEYEKACASEENDLKMSFLKEISGRITALGRKLAMDEISGGAERAKWALMDVAHKLAENAHDYGDSKQRAQACIKPLLEKMKELGDTRMLKYKGGIARVFEMYDQTYSETEANSVIAKRAQKYAEQYSVSREADERVRRLSCALLMIVMLNKRGKERIFWISPAQISQEKQ